MLTPEFIQRLTQGLQKTLTGLQKRIIEKIAERIVARFKNGRPLTISGTDKIQLETLRNAGVLQKDLEQELANAAKVSEKEIRKAFKDAGVENDKYDSKVFKDAGISIEKLNQSPYATRVMERNFKATMGAFQNATRTTLNAAYSSFINACDQAYNEVMSGAFTLDEAVKNAIDTVASDGLSYVTYTKDDDGKVKAHRDTIETAVLRAVRTGVVQATGEISMQRLKENEWDIVLVSSHLGARDTGEGPANHAEWQGKFYSLSGKDYPNFYKVTGYGTGEGLCGWNCRHSFGPGDGVFNPYKQYTKEENHEAYVNSQKARAMERAIRKEKRIHDAATAALKEDPNNQAVRKELERSQRDLVRLNTNYREFCKEHNIRADETRLYANNKSRITDITQDVVNNATPGIGFVKDTREEADKKKPEHKQDEETANWVYSKIGGNVTLIPEEYNGKNKLKTPDALYNDGLMEFKGCSSPSTIDGQFRKAQEQYSEYTDRNKKKGTDYTVVLDVSTYKLDIGTVFPTARVYAEQRFKQTTSVIIRNNDEILKAFKIYK